VLDQPIQGNEAGCGSALDVLVFGGPTSVGKLAAAKGVQSPTSVPCRRAAAIIETRCRRARSDRERARESVIVVVAVLSFDRNAQKRLLRFQAP
jgi:hypothetical protein